MLGQNMVAPGRVKIDVSISGYTFQGNNTKLAVLGFLQTTTAGSGDNTSFTFGGNGGLDWVSWVSTPVGNMTLLGATRSFADITATETTAGAASDPDNDAAETFLQGLAFTIDSTTHTTSYMWDPSLTLSDSGVSMSAVAGLVPLLLAIATLFGLKL
jgi:hypothetical protein